MVFDRRVRLIVIIAVAAVAAVPAWYFVSPLFMATVAEEEPEEAFSTSVAVGDFRDGAPGHYGSGQASVLTDGSSYVLRFEEFSVTNGPDLHVYLSKEPGVGDGDVDLGPLKASQGSLNYAIPAGVDPLEFGYVVIWCVPFSVLFAYASLTAA